MSARQGPDRAHRGGKVAPLTDRTNPLREVPKAIGYLEAGHARGKLLITMQADQ